MKRTAYHTTLKELVHFGLLPPKYEGVIPRTNLHRWRNDAMDRFVGSEINKIANNHSELVKTLNEYPRMFYAYGRLIKTVVSIVGKAQDYTKLVRASKEKVVKSIIRAKTLYLLRKLLNSLTSPLLLFMCGCQTYNTLVLSPSLNAVTKYTLTRLLPMRLKQLNKLLPTQLLAIGL